MTFNQIIKAIQDNQGISVNIDGNTPASGYMVARQGYEVKTSFTALINDLESFLKDNFKLMATNKDLFLGVWVDGETVYIDLSEKFQTLYEASAVGKIRSQLAIWDVLGKKEIRL